MDPNRHHEFITGNNEEIPNAIYFNRGMEDVRTHSQYFRQDRMASNKKSCGCSGVAGNSMCNGCRTIAAEESWSSEQLQRADFRNADTRDALVQSSMYMNAGRPYWQQTNPSFTKEPLSSSKPAAAQPNLERNISKKNCTLESNYNYSKPQQPQLQRVNAIGIYNKDRSYDDKYSLTNHEPIMGTKIGYGSSATAASTTSAIYNADNYTASLEGLRSSKIDHVINPSNIIASKDQHPSPNYARKCPQIFSSVEQSPGAHPNLYMSAPQFSSDKFTNIHTQQKISRDSSQQEYRVLTNSTSQMLLRPESSKLRESPVQVAAPITAYSTQSTKYHQINEPPIPSHILHHQQQQHSLQIAYTGGNANYSSANYYNPQGSSKIHTPEMSPIIMKQTPHTHYQYSKSPLPPSSTHLLPVMSTPTREIVDYRRKEDDLYNGHGIPNRSLYVNPYNTLPSSDSCCKESSSYSSSVTLPTNYRDDSPQGYYKHSKIIQETIPTNKISIINQNPLTNKVSGYRGQTYYYENIKYDGNPHSASSPAAATVASPSPSLSSSASQHQIHHNDYAPHLQYPPYSQPHQIEMQHQSSVRSNDNVTQQHRNDSYERQLMQQQQHQQSSKITPCISSGKTQNSLLAQPAQSTMPQPPPPSILQQIPQTSKKSQLAKPNYRELINKEYAMRNATSEEELNLKIIKKTLNVGAQVIRSLVPPTASVAPIASSSTTSIGVSSGANPQQGNFICDAYRPEVTPTSLRILPKVSSEELQNIRPNVKHEEKSVIASPLDLSMRTIKTKADSTEYKYKRLPDQHDIKYTLPRVDFTPNFSLHNSADRIVPATKPVSNSRIVRTDQQTVYAYPELSSHIPATAVCQKVTTAQINQYQHDVSVTIRQESTMSHELKSQTSQATALQKKHMTSLVLQTDTQIPSNSRVIKTATQPISTAVVHCNLVEGCQVRPSVLETNPYAAVKTIKSEPKLVIDRNVLTVEQLPPDTSVMPLSKVTFSESRHMGFIGKTIDIPPTAPAPALTQSAYSLACEQNPNFLGRKRHLQEYSNSKYKQPVIKQTKYLESTVKSEYARPAEITVIAVNDKVAEVERICTAEKSIQAEILCYQENINTSSSPIVDTNMTMSICKQEPLTHTSTPTEAMPLSLPTPIQPIIIPIKTENNSLIAARIRTKAELKGFTFNPPPSLTTADVTSSPPKGALKIKEEEPSQTSSIELSLPMPSIPGLNEEFTQECLLDFSWSSACNNFVEQLLTNTIAKKPKKKKTTTRNIIKSDLSEDDLPVSTIVLKNDATIMVSSSDIQRSKEDSVDFTIVGENTMSNMESAGTNISYRRTQELNDSTMTKSMSQDAFAHISGQKKISKLDREKMRQQQEMRIAARLQDESSSESDNELDKRKTERLNKPLKKSKIPRNSTFSEKSRFSDCGSDSSTDSDENGSPLKISKIATEPTEDGKNVPSTKLNKRDKDNNSIGGDSLKGKITQRNGNEDHKSLLESAADETSSTSEKDDNKSKGLRSHETIEKRQVDKSIKVQNVPGTSSSNKNKSDKEVGKPKINSKVGLNTMTRSKRKRELELQLANSKVLRNDKIIRNSTTKIKRKYVRKFSGNQGNCSTSKEPAKREAFEVMCTRLRSRNEKTTVKVKVKKKFELNSGKLSSKDKSETPDASVSSADKRKERQADLYMEVYRYKRSLKVPPSLITIEHHSNHKIAASLPDLEKDHNDEISGFPSNRRNKSNKLTSFLNSYNPDNLKSQTETKSKIQTQTHEERRSIIDLLHSRVANNNLNVQTSKKLKPQKKSTTTSNSFTAGGGGASSVTLHSETSQNTESNSVVSELLPTPKKDDDDDDESNDGKKRHFSIFDTKVLKTKTRTESKLQQKREIIREIFVGDDRPASAPPEITQASDGAEMMTYEQKYEQFLQQINIDFNEEKLGKFGKTKTSISALSTSVATIQTIKQEEDTESAGDRKPERSIASVTLSNFGSSTGSRRRRPGRYLRRKGSSGFDYIRKKKKPSQPAASTVATTSKLNSILPLNSAEYSEKYDKVKIKTEDDVCREIQKWVLNKGVGQSTMHKAARLGYIDIIVYCLDRMGMNPDQKDNAGYTPLHEACTNGWLEIARVLLQYGANHSEAAHSGIRPLHEASENDHKEIVRLLLSYGADPLLATYSGQTPLMLASSTAMRDILNNHLSDVQNVGPDGKPWRFSGPWEIFDATECGYDIFSGAPNFTCDMSRALRKSSVSNLIANKKQFNQYGETSSKTVVKMDKCAVVLDNIDRFNSVRLHNDNKPEFLVENSDSEGEIFEFEEADVLLPPLYLLKDEGTEKWVLLNDLCNLLKVKSKDTLLNKIYPSTSVSAAHKSLMRELKMSDFLERATCLQLLCAGEKINICASKVVLIKYNDSVRNLLGVKTILMKF